MKRSWRYHVDRLLGFRRQRLEFIRAVRRHRQLMCEERFWQRWIPKCRTSMGLQHAVLELERVRVERMIVEEFLREM